MSMKAFNLFDGISITGFDVNVDFETDVRAVCFDSRDIQEGCVFFAYAGSTFDSHSVAEAVYSTGKVLFIAAEKKLENIPTVIVEDGRKALALACRNFFGRPDEKMEKVGVTGTNGKTTVTYLLESIMTAAGKKPLRMGTTGHRYAGKDVPSNVTTPSSYDYYKVLADAVADGCDALAVEVSSHALDQERLYGTKFDVALFTNLSGDHLDYHHTMEEYFTAKRRLFQEDHANIAVVNMDNDYGARLIKEKNIDTIKFGVSERAEISAEEIAFTLNGITARVRYPGNTFNISSTLVGLHNLENILAAVSAAIALGINDDAIAKGIENLKNVPGRLEKFEVNGAFVFVDYAHTDDALVNVLEALTPFKKTKITTIFGCGGDRDRTKRPRMAKAAENYSDIIIVTSDNPRTENPQQIIEDILKGFENAEKVVICPDRGEAIKTALEGAQPNDIILIAGKGHEDYMVIGKEKIHFDDREEVRKFLK
ncbi:UDP-N-acetylmuramoyl-L-alanyl-D-glutamate--2,6-diaminopimelate ligase [Geovibrio sp. ADMFC3]